MNDAAGQASGWIVTGFQTISALWVWTTLALLHGLVRSLTRPEPDRIRTSGPVDS